MLFTVVVGSTRNPKGYQNISRYSFASITAVECRELVVRLPAYRVSSANEPDRPMSHFLLVKLHKVTFLKALYLNNYIR
jgi:hypothetical protein